MLLRIITTYFLTILMLTSPNAFSHGSDGDTEEMNQESCRTSGGSWASASSSNWTCCWEDWGCYICANASCQIKCDTEPCRIANMNSRSARGGVKVEGLAPQGQLTPIAPASVNATIRKAIRRR